MNQVYWSFCQKVPKVKISLGFWLLKGGNSISNIQIKFQDHIKIPFSKWRYVYFLRRQLSPTHWSLTASLTPCVKEYPRISFLSFFLSFHLMHASKRILNLHTSSLHLYSPFHQNCKVRIHHQFTSFPK